jgi:propanol-preferring alcohol dehydrogenase
MRAVQYRTIGSEPEVVDVPTPEPGPGQVRLRVTAAGLCHSDAFVNRLPGGRRAPTLGVHTVARQGIGSRR